MGKKKEKQPEKSKADVKTSGKEAKEQKSYSFGADKSQEAGGAKDEAVKVQIDARLESAMLDLIRKEKKEFRGSASQRLTARKLTDMYQSLVEVGFKHKQIEDAMLNTVPYGQDLMDCLDWLCLNTNNDDLPEGFSQALHNEELKLRPKQRLSSTSDSKTNSINSISSQDLSKPAPETSKQNLQATSMKDWILSRYAEETSSDDEEEEATEAVEDEKKFDPNERYLELTAKMLDLKVGAKEAKEANDISATKDFSKQIRKIVSEIEEVKKLPGFNPAVIIPDSDDESLVERRAGAMAAARDKRKKQKEENDVETLCSSLEVFEENALKPPTAVTTTNKKEVIRRSFAYTRQQWTGKSPKQFLNDWVRKHLPQSSTLTFEKVDIGGGLWKSRCKLTRKSKEGDLIVCPEVACEKLQEAEHLASTLALYNLCRGQDLHLLLPPPYRDIWLEWRRAEEQTKKEAVQEDNRPREEFVGRLMKMLKTGDNMTTVGTVKQRNEVKESWEELSSGDEEEEDYAADHSAADQRTTRSPDRVFDIRPIFDQNKRTSQYKSLLRERHQLPAFREKERIMEMIHRHGVFIVAGETGCGKSTQVPQFLLEALVLSSGKATNQLIVCTQPRRISAISLANRVSAELGENGPGKRNSICGYQIRFEKKRCRSTRLLYCTTGIILRLLQDDSYLSGISCVIVDEVHERSMESDFLLINLRHLALVRPELKVVLMSATMDSDKFSAYFDHCPVIEIEGRSFPVTVYHLEDVIERTGYQVDEDSPYALRYDEVVTEDISQIEVTGRKGDVKVVNANWTKDDISKVDRSGLDPDKYSLRTRNAITRLHVDRINLDLIVDLLTYIDNGPEFSGIDGAVLIFLPGLSHIQELNDMLLADPNFGNTNCYQVLALHSVLSSQNQSVAFSIPPKGIRKIVMATNIAETGITIPDVVFVIDSGKEKENRYLETARMSQLQEVFVSKASAQQRCGRAGRVREGICFRLYTQQHFSEFHQYSIPEILRVPLEQLCLQIMKCQLGQPEEFLSKAISAPNVQAVAQAMSILREVGACNNNEATLTALGHFLALLPIDVHLGKMLVYGALLGCLEPAAVIAASMTDKSPFVAPIEKRDMADATRARFALDNSDHLTLYNAFLSWKAAKKRGFAADRKFCDQNFMRRTSLIDIENISQDLIKMVRSSGLDCDILKLLESKKSSVLFSAFQNQSNSATANPLSRGTLATLRAVIAAGLYPNVAKLSYVQPVDHAARPTKTICTGKTAQGPFPVHPRSINRFLATNGWLVFQEKVKYSQAFLRDSTLVGNYPILLFGGDVDVQHKQQLVIVDDWIKFKAPAKTGVLFKEMRLLINQFLQKKLNDPQLDVSGLPLIPLLLELLVSETG